MPSLPGLVHEVHFGDPERPLPDWRAVAPEDEADGDAPPTEDERAAVVGMLGFDPVELWPEPDATEARFADLESRLAELAAVDASRPAPAASVPIPAAAPDPHAAILAARAAAWLLKRKGAGDVPPAA